MTGRRLPNRLRDSSQPSACSALGRRLASCCDGYGQNMFTLTLDLERAVNAGTQNLFFFSQKCPSRLGREPSCCIRRHCASSSCRIQLSPIHGQPAAAGDKIHAEALKHSLLRLYRQSGDGDRHGQVSGCGVGHGPNALTCATRIGFA